MTAPSRPEKSPQSEIDTEIQRFVDEVTAFYRRFPPRDSIPIGQAREIAEEARRPWARGGPVMARIVDVRVPHGERQVRMRLHVPNGGELKPVLLYVHGGGWTMFSLETHDRLMREYADRAGMIVAGIDYSLSPEARFPVALNEIVSAVRWLRSAGRQHGADPERLVLGGDSAGANLALATCLLLRDANERDSVRGILLNYGVFDSDFSRSSYGKYGNGEYLLTTRDMAWFWDNYADTSIRLNPLASVLRAEPAGLPPVFMAITDCDILRDENDAMASKLKQSGVDIRACVYPGTVHGFLEAVSIADVSNRAFDDTARWLIGILNRPGNLC